MDAGARAITRDEPHLRTGIVRPASWLRQRSTRWWLCSVFAVFGLGQWIQTAFTFFGNRSLTPYGFDFPAFYTAGHLVARNAGHLLYDAAAFGRAELEVMGHPVGGTGVLAYFNPPFFAAVFAPLSFLPFHHAFQLWTILNLALLAVDVWMVRHITRDMPRKWRWAFILGFVTFLPVTYGLQHGQFSLILLTSWGAAYLLLRRRADAWAGVALAPLLIKPELLIPVAIYLGWKRRWRATATLAPITALAVAASVAIVGVPAAIDYPFYLLESTRWNDKGVNTHLMFDWNGILAMIWSAPDSLLRLTVVVALSLATLLAAGHTWRGRIEPATGRFAWQWMVLTIATILVDPHLYLQDTILLVIPAAAFVVAAPETHRRRVVIAVISAWALLSLGTFPNQYLRVNAAGLYLAATFVVLLRYGRHMIPASEAPASPPISVPAVVPVAEAAVRFKSRLGLRSGLTDRRS